MADETDDETNTLGIPHVLPDDQIAILLADSRMAGAQIVDGVLLVPEAVRELVDIILNDHFRGLNEPPMASFEVTTDDVSAMSIDARWPDIGATFDGSVLTCLPEHEALMTAIIDNLPALRTAQMAAMRARGVMRAAERADELARPIIRKYSSAERETWRMQEDQARAVIAGTLAPADAAFLMTLADDDSAAVAQMSHAIVAKANQFAAISAMLIRARKAAEAKIATADTQDAIDAAIDGAFAQVAAVLG